MYEGLDTIVLYDELAYEDVVPVQWSKLNQEADLALVQGFHERNLRVLQAMVALEEHVQMEKGDEAQPHAAELARIDKKVSLLLDLVGHLVIINQQRPPAVPIRFNTMGAAWKSATPIPLSEEGLLEIYLRDCIPDPLRLVARAAGTDSTGRTKVRFVPLSEPIADLLGKLAFRRHRRHIADQRHR